MEGRSFGPLCHWATHEIPPTLCFYFPLTSHWSKDFPLSEKFHWNPAITPSWWWGGPLWLPHEHMWHTLKSKHQACPRCCSSLHWGTLPSPVSWRPRLTSSSPPIFTAMERQCGLCSWFTVAGNVVLFGFSLRRTTKKANLLNSLWESEALRADLRAVMVTRLNRPFLSSLAFWSCLGSKA
jgi:hypothetical protein